MAVANCNPTVASRRAKYDGDFRVPKLLDTQPLDHKARALRQCSTQNIDITVDFEKGGKLEHGRLQSVLPVRVKTHRQIIKPDRTPVLFCQSSPGRRQTAIFVLFCFKHKLEIYWPVLCIFFFQVRCSVSYSAGPEPPNLQVAAEGPSSVTFASCHDELHQNLLPSPFIPDETKEARRPATQTNSKSS